MIDEMENSDFQDNEPEKNLNKKHEEEKANKKFFRMYIISSVFLALTVSLCLIFAVQVVSKGYVSLGGYSMFRVVTGSMEPTIETGAVLLNKKTDINSIETGDIVCYRTKIAEIYDSIVTHRVMSVETDGMGNIYLETRGDANLSSDPYYVDSTNLIGKVIWYSGKENLLTNMLSFISGKLGFIVCIVFPILLVAGIILQNAVKNLQRDLAIAKYELEHGRNEGNSQAINEEDLLPGYTTLTYADYEAIYESVKKFLLEEINGTNQEADTKTE